MATTNLKWYGAEIEFSDAEIRAIINTVNTGAAGAGVLSVALTAMGVTGPVALLTGAATAVLTLGGAALTGCNGSARGIYLHVLWVGLPWCRAR